MRIASKTYPDNIDGIPAAHTRILLDGVPYKDGCCILVDEERRFVIQYAVKERRPSGACIFQMDEDGNDVYELVHGNFTIDYSQSPND